MKITVVSDTHGDFETLYEIVKRNLTSDVFIHLGDGEYEFEDIRSTFYDKAFIYVRGNNDWGDWPQFCRTVLGGHMFYMCHGHRFSHYGIADSLAAAACANGCDIALFGHTHVPCDDTIGGIRLFNPGSPVLPRGGNPPSYGIITIDEKTKELKTQIKDLV